VESVKAAADFYAPASGEVVEVNEELVDAPEIINQDPYGKGWVAKIKPNDMAELDKLFDAAGYVAHIEATHEDH
jgi:glycine cleavage system H protein